MISIREVQISGAPRLAEMYSYYVENTAVSFEYEAPTADEFVMRIKHITEKYPYLVCVDDEKVVGYAYAGAYSTRRAYDWTATSSIYVDKEYRRKGIGTLLYDELEKRLKEQASQSSVLPVKDFRMENGLLIPKRTPAKENGLFS